MEEWRVVDLCTVFPLVPLGLRDVQGVPSVGTLGYFVVYVCEHVGFDVFEDGGLHFVTGRPYVFQKYVFSTFVFADWLNLEVNVTLPSQCLSHNQRWTSKVRSFDIPVHSGLEVPVS